LGALKKHTNKKREEKQIQKLMVHIKKRELPVAHYTETRRPAFLRVIMWKFFFFNFIFKKILLLLKYYNNKKKNNFFFFLISDAGEGGGWMG
jgi:hypothetical protein